MTTGFVATSFEVGNALKVTLWNANGNEVEAAELDLPANGQLVAMAGEIFPRIDRFRGTLTVDGGGPLSAVGLLTSRNAGNLITVPIVPLRESGDSEGDESLFLIVAPGSALLGARYQ